MRCQKWSREGRHAAVRFCLTMTEETANALARTQEQLGPRYFLLREAGRGGTATVYVARDTLLEREVAIVRSRAPEVSERLGRQVVTLVQQLRARDDLVKPPGVAETLDWARALERLGTEDLDVEAAATTLGTAVKYREDAERVRQALDRMLAG